MPRYVAAIIEHRPLPDMSDALPGYLGHRATATLPKPPRPAQVGISLTTLVRTARYDSV